MRIQNLSLQKIFTSKGDETLQVSILDEEGKSFCAKIPSGMSTGSREVAAFSFQDAQNALNAIEKEVKGKDFNSILEFDQMLLRLDETPRKTRLGGNTMLGASVAFVRAFAEKQKKKVWELLQHEFFPGEPFQYPLIFANLIEGGAHAKNNLDIQEYMVVAESGPSVVQSVEDLISFYRELGNFLQKEYRVEHLAIGQEGGYVLDFDSNTSPLLLLDDLISRTKQNLRLALDAAASHFWRDGKYIFEGKEFSSLELSKIYLEYCKDTKRLISIEDPFHESDFKGFSALMKQEKEIWIVGDDITTTNPETIARCAQEGLINAVIVKPNQIGLVSESCRAIQVAKAKNLNVIVSHRSEEVEDSFIVHLARASGAHGLKIGAPARERMAKYNALLTIYE